MRGVLGLAAITGALVSAPALAQQSVADFYRGKTIYIVVGTDAGGTYDQSARMMARGLTRNLPGNPSVAIQNMGGANGIPAANHVYNVAPKDGTYIGAITRLAPYEPLMGNPNARFDVTKMRWLGTTASEVGVSMAWHTAPHRRAEDLFTHELVIGATVPGGDTYVYPYALNKILGTKYKIITGYPAQDPIGLAMERGEVQGSGSWSWSSIPHGHANWLSEKKINILFQLGLEKHPELPDVPLPTEFAKTDEDREILRLLMGMKKFGYPFFIAPGVPQERADALAKAFKDTLADPEFLREAQSQGRPHGMADGVEMTDFLAKSYALPKATVERAKELVNAK
jgi:tripartite-type tricarboxylate transporter receptor subunit TctC